MVLALYGALYLAGAAVTLLLLGIFSSDDDEFTCRQLELAAATWPIVLALLLLSFFACLFYILGRRLFRERT
jgi:hypothetical protein